MNRRRAFWRAPSRVVLWLLAALAPWAMASCPKNRPTSPRRPRAQAPKVRIFTESAAVNGLTAVQDKLWVATNNGLIQWDIQSATAKMFTQEDGLPDSHVVALAADAHGNLWVATSKGVARFDGSRWTEFADCPLGQNITALVPFSDGSGVWVGGAAGVVRYVFGRWIFVAKGIHVTSLLNDPATDAVWAGAENGLYLCKATGCKKIGPERGLRMDAVRRLSYSQTGLAAIGNTASRDVLAVSSGGKWATYTPARNIFLSWASFVLGKMYVATEHKLFVLRSKSNRGCKAKDAVALKGPESASQYCLTPVSVPIPSHVTSVSAAMGMLWLGTQSLGVSRFDGRRYVLYRTADLARNAQYLTVACAGDIYCYMANGASAFQFDGSEWIPANKALGLGPEKHVTAFVQGPGPAVTALVRDDLGNVSVEVSSGDEWKPVPLETPLRGPGPLFVPSGAYDEHGDLWVALAYQDKTGDLVPFGGAQVSKGRVIYHRNFQGRGNPSPESLGLPNDIRAVAARGLAVWFATSDGACRVVPTVGLKCYADGSGLSSVVLNGVGFSTDGTLWVSSSEGLNRFDGHRFHDVDLDEFQVRPRGLAVSGRTVWLATSDGLLAYTPGGPTKMWDEDKGLLQGNVRFVAATRKGTIWVLHPTGLSIVSP